MPKSKKRNRRTTKGLYTANQCRHIDPNKRLTFVNNVVGSSKRKCKCNIAHKTWLNHWVQVTDEDIPPKCCAKYCGNDAQVGAHVRVFGDNQSFIWIIPFCQYHNKREDKFYIELKPDTFLGNAANTHCI